MSRFTEPVPPHDPLDELIAAAVHGDLSPQERADFESRLQNDPAADAAYQEAQAMHDLLDQTHRNAQPDPRFEDRMVSGVHRKIQEPKPRETAWGSVVALWSGVKGFLTPKRRPMMSLLLNGVVVLGVCAILAGVALGPITSGIKRAKQSELVQDARSMAQADYQAQVNAGNPNPAMKDTRLFLPQAAAKELDLKKEDYEFINKQVAVATADGSGTINGFPITSVDAPKAAERNLLELKGKHAKAPASTPSDREQLKSVQVAQADRLADASSVSKTNNIFAAITRALPPSSPPSLTQKDGEFDLERKVSIETEGGSRQTAHETPGNLAFAASNAAPDSMPPGIATSTTASSTASSDSVDVSSGIPAAPTAPAAVSASPAAADKSINTAAPIANTPTPQDTRKLIRDAQLDLEVKSFQSTADQITALAKAAGGYVDTSNSQRGGNGKLQGTVVVKVLPQNLDDFLLKLRALGDVKNQAVNTQDVTKDYFDTQAHLENSHRMETQLQDLLKRENGKVSDLLAVERELARVRGDIEQMQGQLKLYDFQVQYGTVTLRIAEKDLKQAAAYLLKEQDAFALFATNVEAVFQKARQAADDFKAQVLVANLDHNSGSDVAAQLDVMVAPEQIEPFLTQIRTMGRVANFTRQSQRVANDGGDSSEPADDTLTERDKVRVQITIRSDNETRKQVALTVVTKAVDDALSQAKAAALAQSGVSILTSSLEKAPQGASTARLIVRVPGPAYPAVLEAFRALGRASALTVQRNDDAGPGLSDDDAPVIVTLSLTDDDAPVQKTDLVVVTDNVDAQSQQIKKDVAAAGMEIKSSTFAGETSGTQTAQMTLRLPLGKYPTFLQRLESAGKVRSLSVARNDDVGPDASGDDAPAEIALTLTHDDAPVQQTDLTLRTDNVEKQAQQIKQEAVANRAEVKASNFQRQPDGTEMANLTLRVPLNKYPDFVAALEKSGQIESLSVHRDDRPDDGATDDTAPAQINLQLHNVRAIVAENDGVWPTLRQTFSEAFAALLGSVRVIGVLLAFIAPWVALGVFFAWIARRIYVRQR